MLQLPAAAGRADCSLLGQQVMDGEVMDGEKGEGNEDQHCTAQRKPGEVQVPDDDVEAKGGRHGHLRREGVVLAAKAVEHTRQRRCLTAPATMIGTGPASVEPIMKQKFRTAAIEALASSAMSWGWFGI